MTRLHYPKPTRQKFSKLILGGESRLDIWSAVATFGSQDPPVYPTIKEVRDTLGDTIPIRKVRDEINSMQNLEMLTKVEESWPPRFKVDTSRSLGEAAWALQAALEAYCQSQSLQTTHITSE